MIAIEYPKTNTARNSLKESYYDVIKNSINITAINTELNKISDNGITLDFKKVCIAEFDKLVDYTQLISAHLITLSTADQTDFFKLFNYKDLQPIIADFFIKHSKIPLSSCFYCEIDFINSFKNIGDYNGVFDFINRATLEELKTVKNIGDVKALKIITQRNINPIIQLSELGFAASINKELNNYDKQSTSNHFTLDHFLPQKDYKYLSLSLFNFVPSCYSCNSKFKSINVFSKINDTKYISPSSKDHSLNDDLKFKIFYQNKLKNIKSSTDYILKMDIVNNKDIVSEYLNIFKIAGRYTFHKEKVTALIKKKNNYSNSKIKEISKLTKVPESQVLKDIFGEEIFKNNTINAPMSKLKKDIAKNIGII